MRQLRPLLAGLACCGLALSVGCGRVYDDFGLPNIGGDNAGLGGRGGGDGGSAQGARSGAGGTNANEGGRVSAIGGSGPSGGTMAATGGSGPSGGVGPSAGQSAGGGSGVFGVAGEGGGGEGPSFSLDESRLSKLAFWGATNGGVAFDPVGCAVGEVAVGLHVWTSQPSGVVPVVISVRCAALSSTGELGSTYEALAIAGVRQTDADSFEDCAEGSMAVGIHGVVYMNSTGTPFITGIGLDCAPLRAWLAPSVDITPGKLFGSQRGNPFTDDCPQKSALRSFSGRKYDFFDALQAHCVKVVESP